jgi:DNA-binding MarR family transcriptional regulator
MPDPAHKPSGKTILNDLPFCLARAAIGFYRLNECLLRQVGLRAQPLGAGTVLHALFEQNDCTVKELAKRTQIPNGTLTGILDRLENDGLVRRAENADDGRSWRIGLTIKGQGMRKQLIRRHEITLLLFNAVFSSREAARLKRDLVRLTTYMRCYVSSGEPRYDGNLRAAAGTKKGKLASTETTRTHEYFKKTPVKPS